MSLKAKLVSTVAAFVMVLALMVVGVLAANSASVDLGGSISFTSDHVLATVSVSATGAKESSTVNGQGDYQKKFTAADATATWTKDDIDLSFASQDTDIVITITVKNDSTERALTLTAETLPDVTGSNIDLVGNVQYSVNSGAATDLAVDTPVTVPATQSVVITMTIELKDAGLSVTNGAWTAAFDLANVA